MAREGLFIILVASICCGATADTSVGTRISAAWDNLKNAAANAIEHHQADELQYSTLPSESKVLMLTLARCANAAYPEVMPPDEFRTFSSQDWEVCVLGRHYEGCRFDDEGYLYVGSGLRARFMENKRTRDIVVAWSGCDLDGLVKGDFSGIADAKTVIRQYCGKVDGGQLEQAAKIFSGIILSLPGRRIDVVGHSLGGAITTYVVATAADGDERVYGTTFNGLGLSKKLISKHMTPWRKSRAGKYIVNIKCDKDPVYAGAIVESTHYGPTYNIACPGMVSHSMSQLISLMEQSN